jgi:hypothetical protein
MEHELARRGGNVVKAARSRARAIALATTLAIVATLAPSSSAYALGRASKSLRLRMRTAPTVEAREAAPNGGAPTTETAPKTDAPKPDAAPTAGDTQTTAPTPDPDPPDAPPEPEPPRAYAGPTAILDVPGREAPWNDPRGPAPAREPAGPAPGAAVTPKVPPPSSVREVPEHVNVAVGLAPEAPGSRDEKALLSALEASVRASANPTTDVRRLRPGVGAPHRICREQREDLVVMIGYVADRPAPVVLAHDCRLDRALSIRAADAAREPGLVAALWAEHLELVQAGARERRRLSVGPKARAGIISGVAIIVVGVAVGALIGSALRKETVVITVRPPS